MPRLTLSVRMELSGLLGGAMWNLDFIRISTTIGYCKAYVYVCVRFLLNMNHHVIVGIAISVLSEVR